MQRKLRLTATLIGWLLTLTSALAVTSNPVSAGAGSWRLDPGETLGVDQQLVSADGRYVLRMQGDGNLVLRAPGNVPIWASGTSTPGSVVVNQGDGNLVIRAPGNVPIWSSGTNAIGPSTVELQTDGRLVIYAVGHSAKWSVPYRDIVSVGRSIGAMGYQVSEHPEFGGVCGGCHAAGSYHRHGRAIDVNFSPVAQEGAKLDWLRGWIQANVPNRVELFWRVSGHYDHLHLAI